MFTVHFLEISIAFVLKLYSLNVIKIESGHLNQYPALSSTVKNVIYYSLLVAPFKSYYYVTYYFLAAVISYTTSYITFLSRPTEGAYLPQNIILKCC